MFTFTLFDQTPEPNFSPAATRKADTVRVAHVREGRLMAENERKFASLIITPVSTPISHISKNSRVWNNVVGAVAGATLKLHRPRG